MNNVLDMQDLRYLNLFNKVTRVNTRYCFNYNNAIIFFVPQKLIRKAIGEEGKNIRYIGEVIKRRVKVLPIPRGVENAKEFIELLVSPVQFKSLEITPNEMIITAGMQSKAALIGRDKKRLMEMQKIIKGFFGRDFRIA
jgi:transcription antitermination factor NusA-like protein